MGFEGLWEVYYQHMAGSSPVLKKQFQMEVEAVDVEVFTLPLVRGEDETLPLHLVDGGWRLSSFCKEVDENGGAYRYAGKIHLMERGGHTFLFGVITRRASSPSTPQPEDMGTFTAIKPPPGQYPDPIEG